jgi:hypothetical protein
MVDRRSILIVRDDWTTFLGKYLYASVRWRSSESNLICGSHTNASECRDYNIWLIGRMNLRSTFASRTGLPLRHRDSWQLFGVELGRLDIRITQHERGPYMRFWALRGDEAEAGVDEWTDRTAIGKYIRRVVAIGITWPVPEELDDTGGGQAVRASGAAIEAPARVGHTPYQLRRRGVTLALLREEYGRDHPVLRPLRRMAPWDHRDHAANPSGGRKLFVDVAGDTVPVFDGLTEEVRAQDLRRGPGGIELHLRPSPARHCPTGSALLSMRSPSRMGCRRRSSATISRPGMVASRYESGVNRT